MIDIARVHRVVASGPRSSTVMLPVENVSRPERLIIQTWAVPVTARVRIEGLALVW